MILLYNYRNNDKVAEVLNDALNYKFDNYIIKKSEIRKYIKEGYIVLSSMYKHLETAYTFGVPENKIEDEIGVIYKTKIGNIKILPGDKFVLLENIDVEFVNGDEVKIVNVFDKNKVEITKLEGGITTITQASKLIPYNFITCHKAQGRTIDKVLLILDDLFEITMLYTAITRAKTDIKFIKFNHLPNKDDIEAFKIMRDIIYKK